MMQNRGNGANKPNGKAGTTLRVPAGSANKKRERGPSRQARVWGRCGRVIQHQGIVVLVDTIGDAAICTNDNQFVLLTIIC